jgi:hypothetical protein
VVIRGHGVAAYCCAHLLGKAGFGVTLERVDRPRLAVILLGDQALTFIRDVFERPGLLQGTHRVSRRVVAWGSRTQSLACWSIPRLRSRKNCCYKAFGPGWLPAATRPPPRGRFSRRGHFRRRLWSTPLAVAWLRLALWSCAHKPIPPPASWNRWMTVGCS